MTHRVLLDLSSLAYRAFFALPTSITAGDGRPVNAVRGYLDMTATLITSRRPDEVLHVLDADWRPAPRVDAYAGYKDRREPEPEEITWQLGLLPELLLLAGHSVVESPGWEADDALAALCVTAAESDRVEVVTGDRDLLQLVRDPHIRVLFTVKGVSELAEFDEAAVVERYGIAPDRYAEFAILRGDPSDGLPGVPGVGAKTAQRLINTYGSIDALLGAADELSPKLAERLRGAAAYLEAMQHVVPLRGDVALRITPGKREDEALARRTASLNLDGPVQRLQTALDLEPS